MAGRGGVVALGVPPHVFVAAGGARRGNDTPHRAIAAVALHRRAAAWRAAAAARGGTMIPDGRAGNVVSCKADAYLPPMPAADAEVRRSAAKQTADAVT